MPNFMITYHGGGSASSKEQSAAQFGRWKTWMENLGPAMLNPGTPLGPAKALSGKGIADVAAEDRLTGYSIVEAADMDAALKIAKDCPFIEIGTVQVAQVMQMQM